MRPLFMLLILAALVSCKRPNEMISVGIPQDSLISKEQMINMLADLHVIESTLQLEKNKGQDPKKSSQAFFNAFFSRYKVSDKRFYASLEYYKQDQGEFIKLYEAVIAELEKRGMHIKVAPGANPE